MQVYTKKFTQVEVFIKLNRAREISDNKGLFGKPNIDRLDYVKRSDKKIRLAHMICGPSV